MLFDKKLTTVGNKIKSNTSEINQLLATVENLQEENKLSQEYLQKLGAAEKASESALEQLKTALLMLKNIDPRLMDIVKQEVENICLQVENSSSSAKKLSSNSNSKMSSHNAQQNSNQETKTNKKTKNNSVKDSTPIQSDKNTAKVVEVEILEPDEDFNSKSHYEAVMKIQQLL